MRRKRVDGLTGVPAGLAQFDVAEWESFDAWRDARSEWAAVHGWPGGVLAKLLQEREVRMKWAVG
ncbi:hypothetical protein ICL81_04550 [Leucobacter sp. cx-328]|uniref:hypothetical protein n=1 Tax=unclassified Leucobacter TaxID=2621730 RepID=UPI00165DDC8A|nr:MULTISPECIES: hypothetical protein [unclassified Leucobacter]MBC9943796.1 hypothetical protein [Leucobacter sp. cx-328]